MKRSVQRPHPERAPRASVRASVSLLPLPDAAFVRLQRLFARESGIVLSPRKRALVAARLRARVEALGLDGFDAYGAHIEQAAHAEERNRAIDLLTTHETYFFREPSHFDVAGRLARRFRASRLLRAWSAACSTGEEAYSLAMTLLATLPPNSFEVVASDLSHGVVAHARRAQYALQRLDEFPPAYLRRFCLRGRGDYDGVLKVGDEVRRHVRFQVHNLLHPPGALGAFDLVFLRNVLIYFDEPMRTSILTNVVSALQPGGVLVVGRCESLLAAGSTLRRLEGSIYQRL